MARLIPICYPVFCVTKKIKKNVNGKKKVNGQCDTKEAFAAVMSHSHRFNLFVSQTERKQKNFDAYLSEYRLYI